MQETVDKEIMYKERSMATTSMSKNISPGTVVMMSDKLYRVESTVKVTVGKGNPFIKIKLRNLATDKCIERNCKPTQKFDIVSLSERKLEFLYLEGDHYLFLDIDTLEQATVPVHVVVEKALYLKEGVEVKGSCYADAIFSIELPQFLEIMVVMIEDDNEEVLVADVNKTAILETGAKIEVPQFIKVGDIIKVDTSIGEYTQRV